MRTVFGTLLLLLAASPALASPVPAPLIGLGIPALGAIGGAVLASKFFRRK
jgi:hypothetical protein